MFQRGRSRCYQPGTYFYTALKLAELFDNNNCPAHRQPLLSASKNLAPQGLARRAKSETLNFATLNFATLTFFHFSTSSRSRLANRREEDSCIVAVPGFFLYWPSSPLPSSPAASAKVPATPVMAGYKPSLSLLPATFRLM